MTSLSDSGLYSSSSWSGASVRMSSRTFSSPSAQITASVKHFLTSSPDKENNTGVVVSAHVHYKTKSYLKYNMTGKSIGHHKCEENVTKTKIEVRLIV